MIHRCGRPTASPREVGRIAVEKQEIILLRILPHGTQPVAPVLLTPAAQLVRELLSKRNGGGLQAIPKLLSELDALFRRKMREIENG